MKHYLTNTKVLVVAIVFLAAILRLWQLGAVPISPDWDEASLGYNAYSILKTGKDEYGNFLPVVLRSFDDYKPALYAYLIIPFITLFDLSVLAVRLPSALIGIFTVALTYFFVVEIIKRKEMALLSSFLLAISPWHIQFSRTAFEASSGMTLNLLMAYFFIRGLKRPWFLVAAAVCGGLSIYMYQSEKVFTPLLMLLLVATSLTLLVKISRRVLITAFLIGLLVLLPMVLYIVSHADSLSRATKTVSFADEKEFLRENAKRQLSDRERNDPVGILVDNRRLVYLKAIWTGYIAHADLNWLFITGDANRHHAPSMGLLYIVELPLLFMGLYYLVFSKTVPRRIKLLLIGWICVTPIPASVGSDVPHAVRTINVLPILQIIVAFGVIQGLAVVKGSIGPKRFQQAAIAGFIFLFILNSIYFLNQYFVQLNYFYSKDWQYGYKEMIERIDGLPQYEKVVISEKAPMDQSYIFVLFYTKFPPEQFQHSMQYLEKHHLTYRRFGKYHIRTIQWEKDKYLKKTLLVGTPLEFPQNTKPCHESIKPLCRI